MFHTFFGFRTVSETPFPPKKLVARPGNNLYARLGGVYPISLFCDRLVDALVGDTSVRITLDAERTMVSLKSRKHLERTLRGCWSSSI